MDVTASDSVHVSGESVTVSSVSVSSASQRGTVSVSEALDVVSGGQSSVHASSVTVASDEVSVASGAGIDLSATYVVPDLSGAGEISSASAVLRGSESISMYSGDSVSAVTEDVSLQAGAAARIFAATSGWLSITFFF